MFCFHSCMVFIALSRDVSCVLQCVCAICLFSTWHSVCWNGNIPSLFFVATISKRMTKAPKSIIYTTIARQGTVLVEEVNRSPQFVHSGNFMQVTHILLPKLPSEGSHTYHYDKWSMLIEIMCRSFDISVMNKNHIMYIAVSHRAVPLRTVFSYLNAVSEEFIAIYGWDIPLSLFPSENIYSQQPFCFTAFASSLNVLMVANWTWIPTRIATTIHLLIVLGR